MLYLTSDLHLEFYSSIEPICSKIAKQIAHTPLEDRVLFLSGDIGHPFKDTYSDFLNFCSKNFRYTLLICGNHEYYNTNNSTHTMNDIENQIEIITSSYDNVLFLNNSYCILKEFKLIVVGSTLWSKPDSHNSQKMINDFNYIITNESDKINSKLSVHEYDELHTRALKTLTEKIEEIGKIRECIEYKNYELIVMTHHLPSHSLIAPRYRGHEINQFFATDLDYLFERFNSLESTMIKYWLSGHTHTRMEVDIHSTKTMIFPYGYPNEFNNEDRDILCSIDSKVEIP
jgi:hypothetical protein